VSSVIKKVEKLVAKSKVAFVGSVDGEGFPNMKAMLPPRKRSGVREFWFTTNTSSERVKQWRENPKACIYFYEQRPWKYQGVMLVGKMEVLEDEAVKKEVWKRGDHIYYAEGVTDPDYCVLKFTARRGKYYCNLTLEDFEL